MFWPLMSLTDKAVCWDNFDKIFFKEKNCKLCSMMNCKLYAAWNKTKKLRKIN